MEKRFVYADNAATTQISEAVLEAMLPFLRECYGNPSNTIYSKGREAKTALETARRQVASALNADVKEIYFTSCGSESINWAIKGVAKIMAAKGKNHIITSAFEHHAVLHTLDVLRKDGFEVTELPVNSDGVVKIEDLAAAIREDTALVTIMYANNEIGTIQPVAEIGRLCRERGVLFHTDAVQAVGNVEIDVKSQCIDLLSLSGHKLRAQKGIGALYMDKSVPNLPNLIHGGGQESGRRAGTENVASIVGLGMAVELACHDIPSRAQRIRAMSQRLMGSLLTLPRTHLNGHRDKRLAGNVNIAFEGVEGESLLLALDMMGICASTGSACTSGSLEPSHVLLAIGLSHGTAHGTLRLSLSEQTTDEDIDYILEHLPPIVQRLRAMSPLWEQIVKEEGEKS